MNPYNKKRTKEQNKKLAEMIYHIDRKVGSQTTGTVLALLCDLLNDVSKNNDLDIRKISITINDFFTESFNFETLEVEHVNI